MNDRQDKKPYVPGELFGTPEENAPERPGWTPLDLPGDILEDSVRLVKELFYEVPVGLYKLGEFYVGNPGEYGKDLKFLYGDAGNLGESTKAMLGLMVDDWKTGEIVHKPIHAAVDLLPVVGAIGKTVGVTGKMAKAARVAELTKVAQSTGKTVEALTKVDAVFQRAEKVIRIGQAIERAPANWTRKAVDAAVMKASGGKWDLARRRQYLQMYGSEEGRRIVKTFEQGERLAKKYLDPLTPEEKIKFDNWAVFGVAPEELAALKASPRIERALHFHRRFTQLMETFYGGEKMLSKERMAAAQLRRATTQILEQQPGLASRAARALAKERFAKAVVAPMYRPNIMVKGNRVVNVDDILVEMIRGGKWIREGKVGALEKLKGAKGYSHDPSVYFREMVRAFRKAESQMRLEKRLVGEQELVKAAPGMVAEGFKIPPTAPFLRYQEGQARKIRAEALRTITDPTIKRLLSWEYVKKDPGWALKLVDWVNRFIARQGTVYNPSWLAGQYFGGAFLAALAGWKLKGFAYTRQGVMPYEILAKSGSAPKIGAKANVIQSFGDTVGEVGHAADVAVRGGIVSSKVAGDLKAATSAGELTAASLEETLLATRQYANVRVKIVRAQERIGRATPGVQRLDRQIADLDGELRAVTENQLADFTKAKSVQDLRGHLVDLKKKRDDIVSDIYDDMVQSGRLEREIPGIKKLNDITNNAVYYANSFVGEYLALDGFERALMRRLWLFYPWTKAMTMLSFRLPFIAPGRTFLWHKFGDLLYTTMEDAELPDWVNQGYIPVAGTADGRQAWLKLTRYSPFEGLRVSKVGGVSMPSGLNVFEKNPLLSLILRINGARTIFDTGAAPYGEPVVSYADGSIVRFREDGTLQKEVNQTPLVQGIVNMSPTVQLLRSALLPYWTNQYNAVGWPEPIYNPDGSYKYPRELQDRLAAMLGINLMTRSKEELVGAEAAKAAVQIKEYRKRYRHLDPEMQKDVLERLRRYSSGEYRKFTR